MAKQQIAIELELREDKEIAVVFIKIKLLCLLKSYCILIKCDKYAIRKTTFLFKYSILILLLQLNLIQDTIERLSLVPHTMYLKNYFK